MNNEEVMISEGCPNIERPLVEEVKIDGLMKPMPQHRVRFKPNRVYLCEQLQPNTFTPTFSGYQYEGMILGKSVQNK